MSRPKTTKPPATKPPLPEAVAGHAPASGARATQRQAHAIGNAEARNDRPAAVGG